MADLERTIQIIFNGDDRISKTISSVSEKLGDLNTIGTTIADPFAKLTDTTMALR